MIWSNSPTNPLKRTIKPLEALALSSERMSVVNRDWLNRSADAGRPLIADANFYPKDKAFDKKHKFRWVAMLAGYSPVARWLLAGCVPFIGSPLIARSSIRA